MFLLRIFTSPGNIFFSCITYGSLETAVHYTNNALHKILSKPEVERVLVTVPKSLFLSLNGALVLKSEGFGLRLFSIIFFSFPKLKQTF